MPWTVVALSLSSPARDGVIDLTIHFTSLATASLRDPPPPQSWLRLYGSCFLPCFRMCSLPPALWEGQIGNHLALWLASPVLPRGYLEPRGWALPSGLPGPLPTPPTQQVGSVSVRDPTCSLPCTVETEGCCHLTTAHAQGNTLAPLVPRD